MRSRIIYFKTANVEMDALLLVFQLSKHSYPGTLGNYCPLGQVFAEWTIVPNISDWKNEFIHISSLPLARTKEVEEHSYFRRYCPCLNDGRNRFSFKTHNNFVYNLLMSIPAFRKGANFGIPKIALKPRIT